MLIGKPPFETNDVKTTYRKIRMNSYTFPDNVQVSAEAKSLIARILHLNPSFRPSLDEILDHEFFHTGNFIPKLLPPSTLACAPSNMMLKQLMTNTTEVEKP
jgi:polo-like kinase 1